MALPTAYLRYSHRNATKRSGGRYEYTDVWMVPNILSADSPSGNGTGPLTRMGTNTWMHEALNANNLPKVGDTDGDGGMVCVALRPRSTEDQGTAEVDVIWQEDPLTLPTLVHYFSSQKTKPAWTGSKTARGANPMTAGGASIPIRNNAKDRYNPPVTYESPLEQIRITKHVSLAWHDSINWGLYLKHWNNDSWAVVSTDPDHAANSSSRTYSAPGSVMLMDKQAPEVQDPYLHRVLTLSFLYDPDLFGVLVAQLGPRANFTAPPPTGWTGDWPKNGLHPVIDSYGNPYGGLAELDANGAQMFPTTLTDPSTMPDPIVDAWYPTNASGTVYAANFNDLALFTPERTRIV